MLAGNVAISSGGGPILGFCGGRRSDRDGTASLPFGPNAVQQALSPCPVNGLCKDPLGASTIGLIYVNPAGPVGATGDPAASAANIRSIFGNMGFGDRETVALVGGGHAFGKVRRTGDMHFVVTVREACGTVLQQILEECRECVQFRSGHVLCNDVNRSSWVHDPG